MPAKGGNGMSTERRELPEPVNLRDKFGLFSDYWSPKIVEELNEALMKAVKLEGEFVWHHGEAEDELFLVVAGRLRIHRPWRSPRTSFQYAPSVQGKCVSAPSCPPLTMSS